MNTFLPQFVLLIVPVYCICNCAGLVHPWKYAVLCARLQLFPPLAMTFHPPWFKMGRDTALVWLQEGSKLPFHLFFLPDHGELNFVFSNCYKVLDFSAKDEQIHLSSHQVSFMCLEAVDYLHSHLWPEQPLLLNLGLVSQLAGRPQILKEKMTRASSKC